MPILNELTEEIESNCSCPYDCDEHKTVGITHEQRIWQNPDLANSALVDKFIRERYPTAAASHIQFLRTILQKEAANKGNAILVARDELDRVQKESRKIQDAFNERAKSQELNQDFNYYNQMQFGGLYNQVETLKRAGLIKK